MNFRPTFLPDPHDGSLYAYDPSSEGLTVSILYIGYCSVYSHVNCYVCCKCIGRLVQLLRACDRCRRSGVHFPSWSNGHRYLHCCDVSLELCFADASPGIGPLSFFTRFDIILWIQLRKMVASSKKKAQ